MENLQKVCDLLTETLKETRKLVEHGKAEEVNTGLFRKKYERIGSCPVCGEPVLSYNKSYSCSNRECKFFISKTIAGKNITETVTATFECGSTKMARVTGDSGTSMISDIIKQIL